MEVGEVTVILTLILTLTKHTKEENGEGKRKISVYFVISLPSLFGIKWRNASMDTIQCNMIFSHIKLHDFRNSIERVI